MSVSGVGRGEVIRNMAAWGFIFFLRKFCSDIKYSAAVSSFSRILSLSDSDRVS